ncbi:DNA mismatch repair protein MutL [Actinoplanes sp. NEAU-A11]|uniref:DNA mismatch repair protein MutL n=1 Tax=Actinoplanes aureus TaxID=2792083 RepID=A0A931C065_9ACTN|nr:DNA mismatch repair protein MutL [Actinoplanes aureus]
MPIAGWCVATATSIVLSSFALSPVLNAARADDELPDLDQLPAAEVAVTTTSPPAPAPAAPEHPAPSASSSTSEPSRAVPSKTRRKPSSKPAATTAPAPPATTRPSTTTENGWTVTMGDDGVKTYVRSFRCDGGQAVIKMTSAGTVALVTATPADGYTVQKTGSDTNLAIYFTSTARSFVLHAQWWNGAPLVEISEVGG